MSRLVKKYYTSNDTWVAPAGVTNVIVISAGGGGGGANGNNGGATFWGGGGGGGSIETIGYCTVVPNTSYTITIGAGGSANAHGSSTTFGSLLTAKGGGAGIGASYGSCGGFSVPQTGYWYLKGGGGGIYVSAFMAGQGGCNHAGSTAFVASPNQKGFAGGSTGANSGSQRGGGGGGGGPNGVGANGGAANSSGSGSNGSNAASNSGAGGGGGGGGSSGAGTGGTGGSGYLYLIYTDGS